MLGVRNIRRKYGEIDVHNQLHSKTHQAKRVAEEAKLALRMRLSEELNQKKVLAREQRTQAMNIKTSS